MIEAKYTRGPWEVGTSPVRKSLFVVSADAWICGELDNPNTPLETGEAMANARLIAAAPELLETLQALVTQVIEYEQANNLAPNPGRKYCWDTTERAVTIIAKATAA